MGTLLDDFFENDAIIGGIIFYGFSDHILHRVFGPAAILDMIWFRCNDVVM
jgi:hypothetical protein